MQSWSIVLFVPMIYSDKITFEENEQIRQDCGAHFLHRRRTRSIDGYKVRQNEFPFIAAISAYKAYDAESSGCTAVQISRRHLLTSAHCVIQKTRYWERYCALHTEAKHDMYWGIPLARFKIYIGTICTHPELCTEQTLRKAKDIIHHEKYDPCTRENDIAVIELDENVRREEGTPVCMPEPYEPLDPTLTAIGFGTDPASPRPPTLFNYLQAVDLSLKEVSYARKMIRTKTPRRSVCTGDSGGPLVRINSRGKHVLVGITSSMKPHCDVPLERVYERDSYFADVRAYIGWICEKTGVCPEGTRTSASVPERRTSAGIIK
ncbi:hypothetical protein V3C99_009589 [Haemonchus contortus]